MLFQIQRWVFFPEAFMGRGDIVPVLLGGIDALFVRQLEAAQKAKDRRLQGNRVKKSCGDWEELIIPDSDFAPGFGSQAIVAASFGDIDPAQTGTLPAICAFPQSLSLMRIAKRHPPYGDSFSLRASTLCPR